MAIRNVAMMMVLATTACGSGDAGPRDGDLQFNVDAAAFPDGGPGPISPSNFRYGVNMGYTPGWTDPMSAELAQRAGVRSLRLKLPAAHLETWGDDIEVSDNQAYAALGMGNHIGFLIGAQDRARSTMPADAADWELEYYPPAGLYEPIFLGNGDVNPNNPWADYVRRVVTTYSPWIRVWHVWNEPDFVDDYQATQTWDTQPPTAAQLVRFHGSIYDYVRLLRITSEVAKKIDPGAQIATGGIGFPNFLDAILRYSDNPDGGAVTGDFPAAGAAYVDVVDFHYYPLFGPRSSDAGVDDYLALHAQMAAIAAARGKTIAGWNTSEVGAPTVAIDDYVGGPDFARNFLVKVAVDAQAAGIGGMDWFFLSNSDAGSDPWSRMGLYPDLAGHASVDDVSPTVTGVAYATMSALIAGKARDVDATAALALPAGARGAAFRSADDGKVVLVLWAEVPAASETASVDVTLTLPASGFERYEVTASHAPVATPTVTLTGAPSFFVER